MPTTRLRHTFKYPTADDNNSSDGDDDDNTPLDEQQQEQLLTSLASAETATNALYVKIFTFLPAATVPAFLFYAIKGNAGTRLLCLLAVTSLVGSGVGMWFSPVGRKGSPGNMGNGEGISTSTPSSSFLSSSSFSYAMSTLTKGSPATMSYSGGQGVRDRYGNDNSDLTRYLAGSRVRRIPFTDVEIDDDGPIGRVLPYLNLSICLLLGVVGGVGMMKGRGQMDGGSGGHTMPEGFAGFCLVPGVILGVVTVVKRSMRVVEAGIGELGKLRYGYKGA